MDKIALAIADGYTLMASDALESLGQTLQRGNDAYVSVHPDTREDADRIFDALATGGEVERPIADQPWGDYYGACTDKYGIHWMVNHHPQF